MCRFRVALNRITCHGVREEASGRSPLLQASSKVGLATWWLAMLEGQRPASPNKAPR